MEAIRMRAYLTQVASDCGRTTNDIIRSAGISNDRLREWMTGKSLPTEEEMEKFCSAAGVESLYKTIPALSGKAPAQGAAKVKAEPQKPAKPKPAPSAPQAKPLVKAAEPKKEEKKPAAPPKSFTAMPEPVSAASEDKKDPTPLAPGQIREGIAKLTAEGRSKDEICKTLGIGRTTYYKYTRPEGESAVKEDKTEEKAGSTAAEAPVKTVQEEKAQEPVPVPAPAKAKPVPAAKPVKKKKAAMPEDMEAAFRGIIKKGEITRDTLSVKVPELVGAAVEILAALGTAVEKTGAGYLEEISREHIPERLRPLMEAAENASDEGLEIATKVLRQFAK